MDMQAIDSPLGKISVRFDDNRLCQIEINQQLSDKNQAEPAMMERVRTELAHYFRDRHFNFSIPVQLNGTDFQQRVWQALCEIPAGSTVSYGELAEKLHSSPRAIGNACRANPVPIIIPCHRVVAKNGIGGYVGKTSGRQLAIKRWLLEHEGVNIN